jgi:hypothetical protein
MVLCDLQGGILSRGRGAVLTGGLCRRPWQTPKLRSCSLILRTCGWLVLRAWKAVGLQAPRPFVWFNSCVWQQHCC